MIFEIESTGSISVDAVEVRRQMQTLTPRRDCIIIMAGSFVHVARLADSGDYSVVKKIGKTWAECIKYAKKHGLGFSYAA